MTPQQTDLIRRSFALVAPMADEAAALVQIQQKITDYYAAHKP